MKAKSFISFIRQSDKYFLLPLTLALLSALTLIGLFFTLQNNLPTQLPLFYSYPWGDNQLTIKNNFLILPLLILVTAALNTLIAWQIHPTQIVLRRIALLSIISINLIILIAGLKILSIFVI